jgi:hypothetical protein
VKDPHGLPLPLTFGKGRRQGIKAPRPKIGGVILVAVQEDHDAAKDPPYLMENVYVLGKVRKDGGISKS